MRKMQAELVMMSLEMMAMSSGMGHDFYGLPPVGRKLEKPPKKSKQEMQEIVNMKRGLTKFEINGEFIWASSRNAAERKMKRKQKGGTDVSS